MESLNFLTCKKCKNYKPVFLTNCACCFCEKCLNTMAEYARATKSTILKCEICTKQINLQTIIDLRDPNKQNLLLFPEKNFSTINNLFSNVNFCIQFFKEQIKCLIQKLEEKDQIISHNTNKDQEETIKKNEEIIKMQNNQILTITEEIHKLNEKIKEKDQNLKEIQLSKKKLQEKSKKNEEENIKYLEKFQKQEEKITKATEKLKKFKEELSQADEEFKEAQTYIKKQKDIKENLEKKLKETEEQLKNYEMLFANNNKNNRNENQQTVKPSEFQKNLKPTLNKNPTIQNKENYLPETNFTKNNIVYKNTREISKEMFGGDNKITENQKDYIKNIYDEKYRTNENNKKRKLDKESEFQTGKDQQNKFDFQKSLFGFKQMKFL